MTKAQREQVRMKFGGRCAYCGCELEKGWCADHVLSVGRNPSGGMDRPQNDRIENLFPACRVCNYAKHDGSIEAFRKSIQDQVKRARAESWNFRMAEKYGLVQISEHPIVFHFETYDRNR